MKNSACIIFPASEAVLSGDVLLFKSLSCWIDGAVIDAGITNIKRTPAEEKINSEDTFLVSENCPLIAPQTISQCYEQHIASGNLATVLCSTESEEICAAWVKSHVLSERELCAPSVQQAVSLLCKKGIQISIFVADEGSELFPIHDARDLYLANEAVRTAVINRAMERGAIIMCDSGIIISPDAVIGEGAVILPGTIIKGSSKIAGGAVIGPNSVIDNSEIGKNSVINASQITDSTVGEGTKIGPFTQLRPNSHVGNGVKIGDFVEIKNSTVGDNTSVAHLTYIGDSDVGRKVNFGCGTVTVNYDGKNKHRTEIGDYAFIGCNSNLVAPVKVGTNAYTAAGSTVTSDVPDDSLYICREKDERVIEGWVEKKLGKRRYE